MILLPIGRDDAIIQRHAWISYALIGLNTLLFVLGGFAERDAVTAPVEARWQSTMRYYAYHPYLHMPENVAHLVPPRLAASARDAQPPVNVNVGNEQRELDGMADDLYASYHQLPSVRYAYVPAEGGAPRIFSSMFLHAGFMHLFGNMLFLFLSGLFVEDVFGRPMFAFLYFSGGIVATLFYASKHPGSMIPLVGASGAIAAIMGAYLARFANSKVEFLFIPFLLRPTFNFRFFMPAFVVLPLWFLEQWASSTAESSGAGVAFSAHVGGFAYGFVVALLIKFLKYEEKFVTPVVEKQTTWKADERVVRARAALAVSEYDAAKADIAAVLKERPNDIDALVLGVELARETKEDAALDNYASRLLGRYIDEKMPELALDVIKNIAGDRLWRPATPRFLARAAQFAERQGDRDHAMLLYDRLCAIDPGGVNAISSLVKLGTLRKAAGDMKGAKEALLKALSHPAASAEWKASIEPKLQALGWAPSVESNDSPWAK